MKAINKQDLINYLKKSPENLNFNIFGTMLDDFRNTYETDEQIVNKIKEIITNIIESGGSISPEDDTITELVDLITELLPEKMIIKPVGTLEITENGEYDVMNKAGVDVQVPLPNGTVNITQNGTTNVNDYEYADVQVPQTTIESITFTENGTYASEVGKAFSPVIVNVIDALADYIRNNITTFEIPEGVTTIPANTFKNYTNLETIVIPDSVTSIGNNAFYGCTNLTTVDGGCFVISIGNNAFYGCPSSVQTGTVGQLKYSKYNNKITISGSGALDSNSFSMDTSITNVIIRKGVTSIGRFAFGSCLSLTNITIPNSVTSIGVDAVSSCHSLTSIEIPNSVTSIGEGAFSDCLGLTSIIVAKNNTVYDSRNDCNAIIEIATNMLIRGCQNTVIPDSVTSIGGRAFSSCTSLTNITIPNSVTSISDYAFSSCTSLTNITIPNSVTSIGHGIFTGCNSLTSVTIPDSVTSINEAVFAHCIGLTSVTIPNSVTSIADLAFLGCTSLTNVYYTGTEEEWNRITIGSLNDALTNATIHYNYTPSN